MNNNNDNDKYNRSFIASSELFSGFTVNINITQIETIDDIIKVFLSNLENVLESNKFINLIEELKKNKNNFHIHTNSIEDILTSAPEDVFYICDHC